MQLKCDHKVSLNPGECEFPFFSDVCMECVCLLQCSSAPYACLLPLQTFCLTLVLTFQIHSRFVHFFLWVKDLKVWRTDPGSIFDIDPLEDNIQSRSLHMLSGTGYIASSSPFMWFCPESEATLSSRGSPCRLCNVNCKVEDSKNQTSARLL